MKNSLFCSEEDLVYPGRYTPQPGSEALLNELRNTGSETAAKAPVNIDEYEGGYRILVQAPGVNREDICVQVRDNTLYIAVLHHDCAGEGKREALHEFDGDCFQRKISLPADADAEFVSAEYKRGILSLYIPKSPGASGTSNSQIVVY
jgi:HSP20 family protein